MFRSGRALVTAVRTAGAPVAPRRATGVAQVGVRAPAGALRGPQQRHCSGGEGEKPADARPIASDFTVSGGTNVNKLAGACCHALREHDSAGMRCIGPRAVNQGAKAVCVARNFLAREEKGLVGRVENARVVSYDRAASTMPKLGAHILVYNNDEVLSVHEREEERVLTVAARTLPRNLAAAIKQNLHAGKYVTLRAVGAEAVENAILGIGFARNYCKQDDECDFDVGFVPEFTQLGENVTGISMMLLKLPPVVKAQSS
eukprot:TRINITY_DN14577_c0_g1_i1.p1 TRINITY_DN14577_c0_g1~~TRINITY_DN14577_c0_g1_i1.p1  ORF type:complete len:259 (+),score=76.79 TRINITY_DN14577_c0_g1_i1:92-868(+)